MTSLFASSACPNSVELGDYVMSESCVDLEQNRDVARGSIFASVDRRCRRREARREERAREFPPPLTMLAMTENQAPHMPFVFRRYHTDDGRLVIVEERVRHHDYFRITRGDGRLRLELVEMDDVAEGEDDDVDERESEECCRVEEERQCEEEEEEEDDVAVRSRPTVVMGGGKCYDYMRVRSSPCLFGLTVPTVRPVHI